MDSIKGVGTQNLIRSFYNSRQNKKIDLDKASNDALKRIKKALADYVKSTQRDLEIQVHKVTGKIIVKIVSKEDGKIIREIPSEELLNLAGKLEEIGSALFDQNFRFSMSSFDKTGKT